jgi:hypothetical protein
VRSILHWFLGIGPDMDSDSAIWATVDEATALYDRYQELQRVNDLVGVLRQETEARPQPPRTDLPLALTPGH